MTKVLEFASIFFLGILLVLAFTHLLNGTFTEWVSSKFYTHAAPVTSLVPPDAKPAGSSNSNNTGGGTNVA